jgi:serine/threonine protein kinase
MSDDPRIDNLLAQWDELRRQGENAEARKLCRDAQCPELEAELQVAIEEVQLADRAIAKARGPKIGNARKENPTPPETHWRLGAAPFPGYQLVRFLGQGGFGEVWEATNNNGRNVALKLVPLDKMGETSEQEALEIIKNLYHPFLLPLLDYGKDDDWLFISTPVADRTLKDRFEEVRKEGRRGICGQELHRYLINIAEVLRYLRRNGIQHCDVKPSNLLIRAGHAVLGDFGLARRLTADVPPTISVGTTEYAPPEFFKGKVSSVSDVYSLAITYCELRGGRLPYPKGIVSAGDAKPDFSMLMDNDMRTTSILGSSLSRNPQDRPSDFQFLYLLRDDKFPDEMLEELIQRWAKLAVGRAIDKDLNAALETILGTAEDFMENSRFLTSRYLQSRVWRRNREPSEAMVVENLQRAEIDDLRKVYRRLQSPMRLPAEQRRIAKALGVDLQAEQEKCLLLFEKEFQSRGELPPAGGSLEL